MEIARETPQSDALRVAEIARETAQAVTLRVDSDLDRGDTWPEPPFGATRRLLLVNYYLQVKLAISPTQLCVLISPQGGNKAMYSSVEIYIRRGHRQKMKDFVYSPVAGEAVCGVSLEVDARELCARVVRSVTLLADLYSSPIIHDTYRL